MSGLILGVFFGAVGTAYLVYGKKTTNLPFVFAGVALMVYPYFIDSGWLIALIGLVIAAVPFALDRGLI